MNTTVVELPSEGKFYPPDNPLSDGTVEIRYMTAADEDILTDQNLLRRGIALDKLVESVVVENGVDVDDMLVGDKGAVIMATRILAYGPKYAFEVECPSCGEKQKKQIDLQEIESKELPEDVKEGSNEFEIELPASGKTATIQLLTQREDKQIRQELRRVKRGTKQNSLKGPSVSTQVTTRLKHYIVALDGERNKQEINQFVDRMPARDSHELRKFIRRINPDIDLSFDFMCDWCGYEEVMNIPLDANFLFPTEEL